MKQLILVLAFTALTAIGFTQNKTPDAKPSNCYTKWEEKFEERGAEEVKDGTYEDISITVRSGPDARCYTGKLK